MWLFASRFFLVTIAASLWCSVADAGVVSISGDAVSITIANGSRLQIYPPAASAQATDSCPDKPWKTWKFHRHPSSFDPFNWTRHEWRTYIVDYPLRSAGLSIAFLLLALIALVVALIWRLVQWCVGCSPACRRCCGVGSEDSSFLAGTKHFYLKAWISLLVSLGLAMCVWGMLALDEGLLARLWHSTGTALDYGGEVAAGMRALQSNLSVALPTQLNRTVALVNSLVDPNQLVAYADAGLNFTTANRPLTDSLFSNASSALSGLQASVVPGLAALAVQLGGRLGWGGASGASRRRALMQAPSSSSSGSSGNETLAALLSGLSDGLPRMEAANATLSGMLGAMQALQSALGQVSGSSSSPPPSPAALASLASALGATRCAEWDTQLGGLLGALQAYGASRNASAFADVTSAVGQVAAGAASLSPAAASGLASALQQLASQFQSGPLQALQALQFWLGAISADAVDVSAWNVTLRGGAGGDRKVAVSDLIGQVLNYTSLLTPANGSWAAAAAAASVSAVPGGHRRRLQQATTASTSASPLLSPQALANVSRLVASVNASVAAFASAALPVAALATVGPDPSPAAATITSTLRPTVAAIAEPAAAVTLAFASYNAAATPENLAALRAAAAAAASPVAAAVAAVNASLPGFATLAVAAGVLEGPTATLGSAAAALNATLAAADTGTTLARGNATLAEVVAGLALYTSLVDSLPPAASVEWTLRNAADDITSTVSRLSGDVWRVARDASSALGSAINSLQTEALDRGEHLVSTYRDDSVQANHVAYAAWMGAWGLAALLLIALVLSVWANWPAGLVATILALLVLVAASQVLCAVLAFALAALADSCGSAERLALQQIVQHTSNPKLSVVLSYYMYLVPADQELALQASFGFNVSDVRSQIRSANATLVQQVKSRFAVRGQLRSQLSSLESLGGSMYDALERLLDLALYERVHPLYDDVKSVVCCSAGDVVYNQWCAITAMAALSLAALACAAYLLGRMDRLAERGRGCCSCCHTGCYVPIDRRRLDEEAAEDLFAKEAQRQQQQQQQQHRAQSLAHPPQWHPQLAAAQPAGAAAATAAGAGDASGQSVPAPGPVSDGLVGGGTDGFSQAQSVAVAVGEAPAAGPAASTAAAAHPPAPEYAAPSAPQMTK